MKITKELALEYASKYANQLWTFITTDEDLNFIGFGIVVVLALFAGAVVFFMLNYYIPWFSTLLVILFWTAFLVFVAWVIGFIAKG